MKKLLCRLFGHRYKISRKITNHVYELECTRCKAQFGIHSDFDMVLPLDDELRAIHDWMLGSGPMPPTIVDITIHHIISNTN